MVNIIVSLISLSDFIVTAAAAAKSLQSCLTLCDAIDSSPPGSTIHGIFQARVLEWGAITGLQTLFSWASKSLRMVIAAMK